MKTFISLGLLIILASCATPGGNNQPETVKKSEPMVSSQSSVKKVMPGTLPEDLDLPPKLGSEQVIFLAYKLAGDTPPFAKWAEADGTRSAAELKRLYKITADRNDISSFHRDLELALYGYNKKTGKVPLGEIKAAFISSPFGHVEGVEVHIENADNFSHWELTPERYQAIVALNKGSERYNYISALEVKGVNQTKPRLSPTKHVLNVSWDSLHIFTKDRNTMLARFGAK